MSTIDRGNIRTSLFFFVLVFLTLAARISFAEPGYSLDYDNYIPYIRQTSYIGILEIISSSIDNMPFFYVDLSSHFKFEVGSVLIIKLFYSISNSEQMAFALTAALAAAIKGYAFVRMRIPPIAVALLLAVSAVLFESNALRLALCVSFLLMAMLSIQHRKWVAAGLWLAAAYLTHIQAVLFIGPFLGIYVATSPWLGKWARWASLIGGVAGAGVFSLLLSRLSIVKLDDYAGTSSEALGINLISVIGIAALTLAGWRWVRVGRSGQASLEGAHRLWGAVTGSTVFALVLLITLTSYGALGGRAWQAAFIVFCPITFWYIKTSGWDDRQARLMKMALYAALCAFIYMTVFRYPLSNFFHPLVPWTDLRFS